MLPRKPAGTGRLRPGRGAEIALGGGVPRRQAVRPPAVRRRLRPSRIPYSAAAGSLESNNGSVQAQNMSLIRTVNLKVSEIQVNAAPEARRGGMRTGMRL